jgi:hypothetical protein
MGSTDNDPTTANSQHAAARSGLDLRLGWTGQRVDDVLAIEAAASHRALHQRHRCMPIVADVDRVPSTSRQGTGLHRRVVEPPASSNTANLLSTPPVGNAWNRHPAHIRRATHQGRSPHHETQRRRTDHTDRRRRAPTRPAGRTGEHRTPQSAPSSPGAHQSLNTNRLVAENLVKFRP